MTARGALVAFGFLLGVMGVVVAVAGPEDTGGTWSLVTSAVMILVATVVTALAATAKPRREDDRLL